VAVSREEILVVVIKALNEAQEDFPDEKVEIDEETKPIGGLACFDSLASVSVTVTCLEAFGYDKEVSTSTLFIDKEGNHLTVGEVVDRTKKLLDTIDK
jgi:hypothetical protein